MVSPTNLANESRSYDQYVVEKYVPELHPHVSQTKFPEVEDYIKQVWGVNAEKAIHVASCESGLNPSKVNDNPRTKDYSVGVFQVNLYGRLALNRPSEDWLKVYKNNVDYAYRMFLAEKWTPWTCAH